MEVELSAQYQHHSSKTNDSLLNDSPARLPTRTPSSLRRTSSVRRRSSNTNEQSGILVPVAEISDQAIMKSPLRSESSPLANISLSENGLSSNSSFQFEEKGYPSVSAEERLGAQLQSLTLVHKQAGTEAPDAADNSVQEVLSLPQELTTSLYDAKEASSLWASEIATQQGLKFGTPVQSTLRPNAHQSSMQRSSSTPAAVHMMSKFKRMLRNYPTRGVSASHAQNNVTAKAIEPASQPTVLNGVSIFYSAKVNHAFLSSGNDTPMQLTNSQKIHRCLSLQAHMGVFRTKTSRSMNIIRSYTVKRLQPLLRSLPFAHLIRSKSLESASFYESVEQLQVIRAALGEVARSKHWFRAGQISASGRSAVMRVAYPSMKCSFCPRVFKGADRKRRYARHCRRRHQDSTLSIEDAEDGESITDGDYDNVLARTRAVISADEFLDANPGMTGSRLYHENTNQSAKHTTAMSMDSSRDTNYSVGKSSYLAPVQNDDLWSEAYIPWAQERTMNIALNPVGNVEASHPWTQDQGADTDERAVYWDMPHRSLARCSQCSVTYNGKHRYDFLQRHINAKHGRRMLDIIEGEESVPATWWPEVICWQCHVRFSGRHGKSLLQQHVVQAHLWSELKPPTWTNPFFHGESPASYELTHNTDRLALPREEGGTRRALRYEGEYCHACARMFTGKYAKGNLRRHKALFLH